MMPENVIGFACRWYRDRPEATWSGTPWLLREAMATRASLAELGPSLPASTERLMKLAYLRRQRGRWTSEWTQSAAFDRLAERQVRRHADAAGVSSVVQMMDYAITEQPFHVYQDLSHAILLRRFEQGATLPAEFNRLSLDRLRRGAERQARLYEAAASVVCMSTWLARDVVRSGIPADRVHVVPPGVVDHGVRPRPADQARTGRLIMVGNDSRRKGLEAVVAALPILRRTLPRVTLTVVGPARWPLAGAVPAGVRLTGPLPRADVARLLTEHDLFVMPSQWEGFGMAFCEALVAGLPCVGRDDCAMPEIISEPGYGRVVGSPGDLTVRPVELAAAIEQCLGDDDLYARVAADRASLLEHYSWPTAARRILAVVDGRPEPSSLSPVPEGRHG